MDLVHVTKKNNFSDANKGKKSIENSLEMIENYEKSSKNLNFDKIYKRMLEIFPRVILFKDLFKDVTGNFYEEGTIFDKLGLI